MSEKKKLKGEKRLIEAEDAEVVIEHYPEDWIAFVIFWSLAFLGLLAFVSWTITERMHFQRMTVFDLPMSYVYAGVAFGCFLMFFRQAQNVWRNAQKGWHRPEDVTHQISAD